ncbi:glycine cleavage system aminomethyltransferase GcvT [Congregibacter litoralis]|uniref:aminomethyltransferase n=1 Tax=Congregibacter litoralis KT71 TaxID=314285 RepID=A4A7L6_9GAMM|nr:glycine cleavage system aminomethyltransferase GcvT [Congregibacter litoralis]EAQ98285.1 glycine cleavage system T protein [Congregibacter litoralis KT71]
MSLKHTPLDGLHRELGARMVPFAGYDMPVQYRDGIIAEHRHTRERAGLFDVSHMGQFILEGPGITTTLESLVPVDLEALGEHRQSYALLTNDEGGVRDDLIITRWGPDTFFLVVNAACKAEDRAWIESQLAPGQTLRELEGQGLLAVQGPKARAVLAELLPFAEDLTFLQGAHGELNGAPIYVTCSGYTGEDGYELSVPEAQVEAVARSLLAHDDVAPIGLGARDSLRLESGLCLYGHELSPAISPIEAKLNWSISKSRRSGGAKAGGYPGAERIAREMSEGTSRVRVGMRVLGKRPVREGQNVLNAAGEVIGAVSSGAFAATVDAPVAMAFVDSSYAALDTELSVDVRGKALAVVVCKLPLVPQRYYRG